jgi:hypothetical protein
LAGVALSASNLAGEEARADEEDDEQYKLASKAMDD